jgi:hypothetical protein
MPGPGLLETLLASATMEIIALNITAPTTLEILNPPGLPTPLFSRDLPWKPAIYLVQLRT